MKLSKYCFGVVGLLLCSALFFTSCEKNGEGGAGSNAPSSVAGKTITFIHPEGYVWVTIEFSSNTSGKIDGGNLSYSSLQYKKTGSSSAAVQVEGYEGWINPNRNFSLTFSSPNQGVFSSTGTSTGVGTFTLF